MKASLACKQDHFWSMDVEEFERFFQDLPPHEKYKDVGVLFVTLEDDCGDYCYIKDNILYLVLHVAPSTEAMIEAFERNFFTPVDA